MADMRGLTSSVVAPRTQALGDQVLDQLRVLIVSGQLRPGTHLVEAQLSASFGISRAPVRDALAQLEAEGLVEGRKRGAFVRGLTVLDINELYTLREAIEAMALRLASAEPASSWSVVDGPMHAMETAARAGDHTSFAHADLSFHTAIYAIADHSRLSSIWRQYEPTFSVLLELTTAEDIDLTPSYESHVGIRDLCLSGQVTTAISSLQEHLAGSRSRLLSAYARLLDDKSGAATSPRPAEFRPTECGGR